MNYYNEWDPYAAQWIRNLIDAGLIPPGHVDTRSITDVQPSDLAGYRQCHFFCGIAGWSLAARLAGWPDDRELWTGSAPCQPFSVAGKGKAQDDDRHLWPHFLRLIRARRPAVVMGEQVAAAVGKNWLDGVSADLEAEDYACRAVVVPACAVDAPHRRDRLWFVAHSDSVTGRQGCAVDGGRYPRGGAEPWAGSGCGDSSSSVGHPNVAGAGEEREQRGRQLGWAGIDQGACSGGSVADAGCRRLGEQDGREVQQPRRTEAVGRGEAGSTWDGAGWIIGHDGKARRFEPGIRLLAHGVPGRVGRLRAYGNAIVPQVAAEVIGAYMDCYPDPDEQLRAALATN
ncbi:TPA: DNA cytosine methyltransferase [Stenotrophomonas maltophilia]|nr:DNA cytosine methyltransferase [Stenotrophomonas maltophilia]